MIVEIYKTHDMEAAMHAAVLRHKCVMAYERSASWCRRHIRVRRALLKDLSPKIIRSWDESRDRQIADWKNDGGLIFYRDVNIFAHEPPKCDCVILTEMPVFPEDFYRIYDLATKEIIVFVPPDWSMHEEELNIKAPLSDVLMKLRNTIESIRGKKDHLTRAQEGVLEYSGYKPETTAVFASTQLEEMAGVAHGCFKRLFKGTRAYARYECYRPMIAPEQESLIYVYEALEQEPSIGGGVRALRNGVSTIIPKARIDFKMKLMVRAKNAAKLDDVYLIHKPLKPVNFDIHDAEQSVIRKQHYKLREFIDDKQIYPLK